MDANPKTGRFTVIMLVICMCCIFSGASWAEDYFARVFDDMDLSHDGYVSVEEYSYYKIGVSRQDFDQIDLDKDGKLALFEFVTHQQSLDPDVFEYRYKYESPRGHLIYHRDKAWYKISNGFRFKFQNGEWKKEAKIVSRRSNYNRDPWCHYDCRHHDGFYHDPFRRHRPGLGIGFGYRFCD